jgi:BirA family biotin operon repressor/biotin-[acetyl-CoA-carboxylase] ligase
VVSKSSQQLDKATDEVAATNQFNPYNLQAIEAALQDTPYAGKLHHFSEIGSTNTYAMGQGALGAPNGSVYFADMQTAGRGRGAHTWASPARSGIYVSVLLRPALAPGDTLWFSLAAGLAVLSAVRSATHVQPDLRWPNDILLGPRKVAGILTEMHAEATRVRHLVIGIGVNVHQPQFPAELEASATSLAIEGAKTTRDAVLVALLKALDSELTPLSGPGAREARHSLMSRVGTASTWMSGKAVVVEQGQSGSTDNFAGVTAGLDDRGFLLVQTADGLRTVLSGGVREQERA